MFQHSRAAVKTKTTNVHGGTSTDPLERRSRSRPRAAPASRAHTTRARESQLVREPDRRRHRDTAVRILPAAPSPRRVHRRDRQLRQDDDEGAHRRRAVEPFQRHEDARYLQPALAHRVEHVSGDAESPVRRARDRCRSARSARGVREDARARSSAHRRGDEHRHRSHQRVRHAAGYRRAEGAPGGGIAEERNGGTQRRRPAGARDGPADVGARGHLRAFRRSIAARAERPLPVARTLVVHRGSRRPCGRRRHAALRRALGRTGARVDRRRDGARNVAGGRRARTRRHRSVRSPDGTSPARRRGDLRRRRRQGAAVVVARGIRFREARGGEAQGDRRRLDFRLRRQELGHDLPRCGDAGARRGGYGAVRRLEGDEGVEGTPARQGRFAAGVLQPDRRARIPRIGVAIGRPGAAQGSAERRSRHADGTPRMLARDRRGNVGRRNGRHAGGRGGQRRIVRDHRSRQPRRAPRRHATQRRPGGRRPPRRSPECPLDHGGGRHHRHRSPRFDDGAPDQAARRDEPESDPSCSGLPGNLASARAIACWCTTRSGCRSGWCVAG